MRIIDLSQEIFHNAKAYPGFVTGVEIQRTADFTTEGYNRSAFSLLDFHYGTHIDMPSHFIQDGATLSSIVLIHGKARIFKFEKTALEPQDISISKIRTGEIILISAGWDRRLHTKEYFSNYPYLSEDLAEILSKKKIKCLGIDTPSPDKHNTVDFEIHKTILGSGIPIIEGLINLNKLAESKEQAFFIAMPLNIKGVEASPVRAIAVLSNSRSDFLNLINESW